MNRSDLVQQLLKSNKGLRAEDMDRVVRVIFNGISEGLARGERAEFRGFGSFSVRHRKSRVGRNPRTRTNVLVPSKHVPYFRAGKSLRDMVDKGK